MSLNAYEKAPPPSGSILKTAAAAIQVEKHHLKNWYVEKPGPKKELYLSLVI